jgi:hypothetical protein
MPAISKDDDIRHATPWTTGRKEEGRPLQDGLPFSFYVLKITR